MQRNVAVVTPYHREAPELLRRCIDSVAAQSLPCTHYVVADGHPQDWVSGLPNVRHLALPSAHADFGNTPRGIGALLAAAEGCAAISFLDADNHYDRHHVRKCLRTSEFEPDVDYVIARRRLVRMDGSEMPFDDQPPEEHVDTSCFFLLRRAFHMLGIWLLMPKIVSRHCDSVFYAALRHRNLKAVVASRPTVNYLCTWKIFYERLGETPPPFAKSTPPNDDIYRWYAGLTGAERDEIDRLVGFPLERFLTKFRNTEYPGGTPEWRAGAEARA